MAAAALDGYRTYSARALFPAAAWLASPVPALLVILFVLAGLAHALVGLRSVFADYVHRRGTLVAANLIVRAATILLAGASTLAVLKIFLGR
jgi:succinate dehydrogenase / fumarate reductase membrane anchor subunit